MIDKPAIRLRWELIGSKPGERGQRLFATSEARAAGWGGKAVVAAITGLAFRRLGMGSMNSRGHRCRQAGFAAKVVAVVR